MAWNNGGGGDPIDEEPEKDPFGGANSDPFGGPNSDPFIDWSTVDQAETEKIEESTDDEICDHEDHKQIFTKEQSGGVNIMGTGASGGRSVEKVYCSKCDRTWRLTDDDPDQSPGGLGLGF